MAKAFSNLISQEKDLIDSYQDGNILKNITKHSGELHKTLSLRKEIQETDFVQHFREFNHGIEAKTNFIGGVLSTSFDSMLIGASNQTVIQQGGISIGSLIIAFAPNSVLLNNGIKEHFILLRVANKVEEDDDSIIMLSTADKSLLFSSKNKKENHSGNYVDKRTENITGQFIQFNCAVIGMYYKCDDKDTFDFTPQVNLLVAATHYLVAKPDDMLLNVILNTQMVLDAKSDNQHFDYFPIGVYRETEADSLLQELTVTVPIYEHISMFLNCRTANFGNTRFGKSNLNKIYASNIIQYNVIHQDTPEKRIGMLIYDENGEYYHVNTQDNTSLYEKYKNTKVVSRYTLRKTQDETLMLNFYLDPNQTIRALRKLLSEKSTPTYIESFTNTDFIDCQYFDILFDSKQIEKIFRPLQQAEEIFKLQLFWCLLKQAGFEYVVKKQNQKDQSYFFEMIGKVENPFTIPSIIMNKMQSLNDEELNFAIQNNTIQSGDHLEAQFVKLFNVVHAFIDVYVSNKNKFKDKTMWDRLDPLLEMFNANSNKSGYKKLYSLKDMHSEYSNNQTNQLIEDIVEKGNVCILDLSATSNARAKRFYAEHINSLIFRHAEINFSKNLTKSKPYILLDFEEAHNLFPSSASSDSIYIKIAREGAKMNIGVIYNTQLISYIYSELKSLTENIFVGYINDQKEVSDLVSMNFAFSKHKNDIMTIRKVGYMTVLTRNRRFPIRVQINKFE